MGGGGCRAAAAADALPSTLAGSNFAYLCQNWLHSDYPTPTATP